MAPKRKATEEPETVDSSSYHPNFPLYLEADLVVETSNGILFATRALFLRAVSSVFDDILALSAQHNSKDGHLLIKIEERGEVFEVFLRYAHRDRHLIEGKPASPPWPTILLLSKLFDKYDATLLAKTLLSEQLPRFVHDPSVPASLRGKPLVAGAAVRLPQAAQVFAIAVIHGLEDMAQRSMKWFGAWETSEAGRITLAYNDPSDPKKMREGWRP